MSTKFCQNQPGFVDDVTKNIWCVFGFAVPIVVQLQSATLNFTRWCSDIIQVSWKTFKLLYHKFIQDNAYQIFSESTGFGGRHDKNILECFFWFTV